MQGCLEQYVSEFKIRLKKPRGNLNTVYILTKNI